MLDRSLQPVPDGSRHHYPGHFAKQFRVASGPTPRQGNSRPIGLRRFFLQLNILVESASSRRPVSQFKPVGRSGLRSGRAAAVKLLQVILLLGDPFDPEIQRSPIPPDTANHQHVDVPGTPTHQLGQRLTRPKIERTVVESQQRSTRHRVPALDSLPQTHLRGPFLPILDEFLDRYRRICRRRTRQSNDQYQDKSREATHRADSRSSAPSFERASAEPSSARPGSARLSTSMPAAADCRLSTAAISSSPNIT